MRDDRPRDASGKFEENPDSLCPKTIGVRISKKSYPKFIALAEEMNIRPAELARQAIEEYLGQHWDEEIRSEAEVN